MKAVAQFFNGLGDVVFPRACVHCRELVDGPGDENGNFRHLCARCVALLAFVRPPHCSTCGHPYYGVVEGERMCPHCEGLNPAFGEGRTAVLFKGPARALVIELKYHRGLFVLEDMAAIFHRTPQLLEHVKGATLIPGAGARGDPLLRRVVDSESQTAFDRRTRMANLKNAFALAPGATLSPNHHYILVDDVFTTGSTLNSCARALRRAGGLKLDVVTFGHG
jgi:predicted amidophosphoribosyltransferase